MMEIEFGGLVGHSTILIRCRLLSLFIYFFGIKLRGLARKTEKKVGT